MKVIRVFLLSLLTAIVGQVGQLGQIIEFGLGLLEAVGGGFGAGVKLHAVHVMSVG